MERFDLNYMDLGGGLNLGPNPSDIADNEQCSLVNYLPVTSDQRLRPGFRRLTDPYTSDGGTTYPSITGIHEWSDGTNWELFVGTFNSFARWSPSTLLWTRLPRTDAVPPGDHPLFDEPWCMLQYRGIIYAFRRDVGMRRLSRAPLAESRPGIPAPTTAPTLADGAAGAIPAANFQGLVTFYSPETGAESNPSPASGVLAHGAGLQINWSSLPATAPAGAVQVSHIRLYRTLPDKTSTVPNVATGYLVATLPIGTLTYADNFLVEQLGAEVSRKNDLPPAGLRSAVIWQERLWAHDGRNLYVSEIGKPESIPAINVLQIFPDDGQEIVGLDADETRLFIGKEASVIYLTGSVPNLERHVLDANNGVTSHHTMKAVGGRLIWRSKKDVLVSEGGAGNSLTSGRKLRTYMENVQPVNFYTEVAEVIPERNLYLWMGRFTAKTTAQLKHPHAIADRDVLALNYETGAWGVIRLPLTANKVINCMKHVQDQTGAPQLYLGYEAFVHVAEDGRAFDDEPVPDSSTTIRETALSSRLLPRETSAPPGHVVAPQSLWLDSTLQTTQSPTRVVGFRLVIYRNADYATVTERAVGPAVLDRGDQVFGLNIPGNAASKLLVGVKRDDIAQSFDIFGIGLGGWKLARRHRRVA
jgi:hypothetical protein